MTSGHPPCRLCGNLPHSGPNHDDRATAAHRVAFATKPTAGTPNTLQWLQSHRQREGTPASTPGTPRREIECNVAQRDCKAQTWSFCNYLQKSLGEVISQICGKTYLRERGRISTLQSRDLCLALDGSDKRERGERVHCTSGLSKWRLRP
jgi:hypothetical protein